MKEGTLFSCTQYKQCKGHDVLVFFPLHTLAATTIYKVLASRHAPPRQNQTEKQKSQVLKITMPQCTGIGRVVQFTEWMWQGAKQDVIQEVCEEKTNVDIEWTFGCLIGRNIQYKRALWCFLVCFSYWGYYYVLYLIFSCFLLYLKFILLYSKVYLLWAIWWKPF